ncbi:hypothetical protein RHMOL_Rhmol08G0198700 [Rhododendron molle]|uniref:Uncharacterized protein n=1 Tax=Rhododendron molle TaxID=49168 RepID=A0ACC0MQ79_RHOML|nr:hypothetical protein RHMOL_Rhmol08G0198700 [Rhododendron molle]
MDMIIAKAKMSSNKRKRTPYTYLSQDQKDRINANKRASYHRNKKRLDELFPVGIEDQISAEENITSSLFLDNIEEHAYGDQHLFPAYATTNTKNAGPSTAPSPLARSELYVIFAILEVGERKPANRSYVTDVKVVDQRCIANSNKIKQLPSITPIKPFMLALASTSSDDPVKIINLPTSVEKTQFINIEGIAKVVDFNQRFCYLACSLCNKASNAHQNQDLWCNYCAKKVPPLIRIKFSIQIEDATGAIEATVFPEIAETIYGLTGFNITSTAPGESLSPELLHKLSEPKDSKITLRAYMYTYAGISQLRFTVHSMSIQATSEQLIGTAERLALPPSTPAKREKPHTPSTSEDPAQINPVKKPKLAKNE